MEGESQPPDSWRPVSSWQDCCGTYTFIPYVVTAQNKVLCCDASTMKCLTELFQPSFNVEAFFTPLAGRLAKLLEGTPTNSWYRTAFSEGHSARAGHGPWKPAPAEAWGVEWQCPLISELERTGPYLPPPLRGAFAGPSRGLHKPLAG